MSVETDTEDGGPTESCQFVDFSADEPERCGDDAPPVQVGGVTTRLCDKHAQKAREELVA